MTYNEFKAELKASLIKDGKYEEDTISFIADTLIIHLAEIKKSEMLLCRGETIPPKIEKKLLDAIIRLQNDEPLQYILGEWEFFGLRMFCGKGCLIPRPETEMLAKEAIRLIPNRGHFLDLCTGSGCIAIAVLNNRPDVTGTAVDISPEALEYAKVNADYHKVKGRLKIVCRDIYDYEPITIPDVILANPPYIKSDDIPNLPKNVLYEPKTALDGGHDGLDFYKLIGKRYAKRYLKSGGSIILEVGYDIAQEVAAILRHYKFETTLMKDLSGNYRLCVGTDLKIE